MRRRLSSIFALFCLLGLASCTARYQDMLRDRDAQIRELNGRLSDLRAANADLEQRERVAREEADRLRGMAASKPVEAATDRGELDKIRRDLPELDVRYSRGRLSIGIENSVTFDSGSTALKSSASQVLGRVAEVLRRDFSNRRIYVEGHTDTDPIRKTKDRFRSNRHLSAERADSVAQFLTSKGGVPERQIVVVGFGPFDPRTTGNNEAAKARNRRVEVVVGEEF
jgi:chemotaxis protein MotB